MSVSDESEDSDGISKYKALLQEIEEGETKKTKDDVHLEITWGTGRIPKYYVSLMAFMFTRQLAETLLRSCILQIKNNSIFIVSHIRQ